MITEVIVIPLEGEQPKLFQKLERDENAARAPFQTQRNNMTSALLAGKGLLEAAQNTPGLTIVVNEDNITLTPENTSPLKLEQSA